MRKIRLAMVLGAFKKTGQAESGHLSKKDLVFQVYSVQARAIGSERLRRRLKSHPAIVLTTLSD